MKKNILLAFSLLLTAGFTAKVSAEDTAFGIPRKDLDELAVELGLPTTEMMQFAGNEIVKAALQKVGFTQEQLFQGFDLFFNRLPKFPERFDAMNKNFQVTTSTGKTVNKLQALLVTCRPGGTSDEREQKLEAQAKNNTATIPPVCQSATYCNGTTRLACYKAAFNLLVTQLLPFFANEFTNTEGLPYTILGLRNELKPVQESFKKNITIPTNNLIKIISIINKIVQKAEIKTPAK